MTDVTVIRHSVAGEKFEILVKPDPALEYKLGKIKDVSTILVSDEVYTDSGKGTKASTEKLLKAFGTQDTNVIIEQIIKKGELNLTTDQRRKMIGEKRKQIINFIAKTYVDPRSHLPHPPMRIEQALEQTRISIDPFRNSEEQAKDIVEKLRTIIPLKSENMLLEITVPAQYAAQSYSVLKSNGTIKKEEWQNNGSLKAILEIPAGARANVIDRLGSITKGAATVEMVK
jgi:ribosome maturation protein SDO1